MSPVDRPSRSSTAAASRDGSTSAGAWRVWKLTEDVSAWSAPVGRLLGVRVRIHALLLLLIAAELIRSTLLADQETVSGPAITATALLALLIVIFAHEIGKALMTRWMGGSAESIVLWPLGGLSEHQMPTAWRRRFLASCGGLLLSIVLASALWPMLIEFTPNWYSTLTNPLNPGATFAEWVLVVGAKPAWWLTLLWWIGYANLLVIAANLVPVYPLDGAHAAESVLMALFGRRRGRSIALALALTLAVIIVFASLLAQQVTGVFLGGFAMLCCITTARRQAFLHEQGAGEPSADAPPTAELEDTDFDDVITRAPRSISNLETTAFQVRLEASPDTQRVARRAPTQSDRLATEEEVVDRILAKISTEGLASLTEQERKILESVTARRRRG